MLKVSRPRLKPLAAFCYVWLMVGFFLGTAVLLGPARWMTTAMRARGFDQRTEDLAMLAVILLYLVASFALALAIVRWTGRCGMRRVRIGVPAVLTLAAGISLWGWLNPATLAGASPLAGERIGVGGAQFVFGPYPDAARLVQLKNDGYTAVISLQHPAVMPFEPVGIRQEQASAASIGLPFIHAPMMPWVSSNEASLSRIREIARTGRGRYYVHCGLGRDRVNLVKRMLEREGARVADAQGLKAARTLRDRVAEKRPPFERGRITEIERDLWLIPYPNKHEFFSNLLSGQVSHVTLVLDPSDPQQSSWIDEARRVLGQHAIAFDLRPLRGGAEDARAIVDAVRAAPRPEIVVVPFTEPSPSTEVAAALTAAFAAAR